MHDVHERTSYLDSKRVSSTTRTSHKRSTGHARSRRNTADELTCWQLVTSALPVRRRRCLLPPPPLSRWLHIMRPELPAHILFVDHPYIYILLLNTFQFLIFSFGFFLIFFFFPSTAYSTTARRTRQQRRLRPAPAEKLPLAPCFALCCADGFSQAFFSQYPTEGQVSTGRHAAMTLRLWSRTPRKGSATRTKAVNITERINAPVFLRRGFAVTTDGVRPRTRRRRAALATARPGAPV